MTDGENFKIRAKMKLILPTYNQAPSIFNLDLLIDQRSEYRWESSSVLYGLLSVLYHLSPGSPLACRPHSEMVNIKVEASSHESGPGVSKLKSLKVNSSAGTLISHLQSEHSDFFLSINTHLSSLWA